MTAKRDQAFEATVLTVDAIGEGAAETLFSNLQVARELAAFVRHRRPPVNIVGGNGTEFTSMTILS